MSGLTAPGANTSAYRFLGAYLALLGAVTWSQNSATRQYFGPWYLAVQVVYWVPIGWWLWRAATRRNTLAFRVGPDLALLAIVVGGVIAAAFSPFRWISIPLLIPYLATAGTAWSVRNWLFTEHLGQEARLAILRNLLAGFFAIQSFLSLARWLLVDALPNWIAHGWATYVPRNEFPFGHSTYVAGFAVLSFPWLLFAAWKAQGRLRFAWITGAATSLLLIASTSSRGGVIGAGLALMLGLLVLFERGHVTRRSKVRLGLATVLALVLMVALNPRLRDSALHGRWNAISDASNAQRSAMIQAGLQMGKDRAMTGWGPGAVPLTYPRYRSQLSGGVENVLQLHNTPIQLWAEMGCAGIAAWGFLAGGALVTFIRTLKVRRETLSPSEEFSILSSVTLLAYLATTLTDFQWDVPAFACVLGCSIAGLDGQKTRARMAGAPRINNILVLGSWFSITFFALWGLIPFARTRLLSTFASEAMARGDRTAFVQGLTRVSELLPQNPLPLNQIAAYLIEERAKNGDPATRDMLAFNIVQCFNASLRRDEAQEYVHFNYGWLLLERGQPGAAEHFRAAARLVPDKGGVYLGLALALLQAGKLREASAALALECLNDPAFLTSPWWELPAISQSRNETAQSLQRYYTALIGKVHTASALGEELRYEQRVAQWFLETVAAEELVAASATPVRKQFWRQAAPSRKPSHFSNASRRSYRRERTGYPILMRTPEMKPPIDLYQVQENERAASELAPMFAPKGWLPPPLWLEFLGETGSAN